MRKIILLIFMTINFTLIYGQSEYSRGFQAGYKEGYCYNDFGCIAPIPPITPTPTINEHFDSYKDGYNRGFLMGKDAKNSISTQKNKGITLSYGTTRPNNNYTNNYSSNRYENSYSQLDYCIDKANYLNKIATIHYNKGILRKKNKRVKRALRQFRLAEKNFTLSIGFYDCVSNAYFNRGLARIQLKDYSNAKYDYTKEIEMNPNYTEAYFYRGLLEVELKQFNLACVDFRKAQELGNPDASVAITKYCE